jgi:hypothetical protein
MHLQQPECVNLVLTGRPCGRNMGHSPFRFTVCSVSN